MILAVQIFLGGLMLAYLGVFVQDLIKNRSEIKSDGWMKNSINCAQGFITNFLDTLGIGSFAPQTVIYRSCKLMRDESNIPGTLNVANTIPVMFEGFIFLIVVQLEALTLICLVLASIIGGLIGARIIKNLPVKKVQLVIAFALFITAVLMLLRETGVLDILGEGNTALGLSGWPLILAMVGLVVCGMGQAVGVGFYAPCMAIVYFAGMDPLVAFPIMMVSCASVMPMASISYIKSGKYEKMISIIIMVTGIIGVAVAAFFVKNMDKTALIWIVVFVVFFASFTTLKQALKKEPVEETGSEA